MALEMQAQVSVGGISWVSEGNSRYQHWCTSKGEQRHMARCLSPLSTTTLPDTPAPRYPP